MKTITRQTELVRDKLFRNVLLQYKPYFLLNYRALTKLF